MKSSASQKSTMSTSSKHHPVILPSTCTGDNALSLDFTPFETILQWKRMLECDEFVGARQVFHYSIYAFIQARRFICEQVGTYHGVGRAQPPTHYISFIQFFIHTFYSSFSFVGTTGAVSIQWSPTKMPYMCLAATMAKVC